MKQYDNAKAVADFMNNNPFVGLDVWNDFAAALEMIPFNYSDDDWYRNDEYVVSRVCGRYGVVSIDRYDVERKTVWRVLHKGEPISDWKDSFGDALECAMTRVRELESKRVYVDTDISFEKKMIII